MDRQRASLILFALQYTVLKYAVCTGAQGKINQMGGALMVKENSIHNR
jgi:hypothetical protein